MPESKKESSLKKLKRLFFHPKKFFDSVENEKTYSGIMFFYVKIYSIYIAISLILSIITLLLRSSGTDILLGMVQSIMSAVFSIGVAFISPFIISAIIYLGVLIFRGKQKFFNTYKPVTYAVSIAVIYSTIAVIVSWVLSMINSTYIANLETMTAEQLLQNSGYIFTLVLYGIIMLISIINVIYASTIGISKFQKISKLRAFLSTVLIPLILFILIIIFLVWFYTNAGISA